MGIHRSLEVVKDPEQPLRYRYEAIIDYMLANPHLTQGQIADLIGCTQGWLSQVISSNGFQARYAERRHALSQEQERLLSHKIYDMASKASDRVIAELDKGEDCDAGFALDAATRALRAIGMGAPPSKQGQETLPAPPAGDVNSETLRLARHAIERQSMIMTRVTERVEISPDTGHSNGRVVEGSALVEADFEEPRKAQEG